MKHACQFVPGCALLAGIAGLALPSLCLAQSSILALPPLPGDGTSYATQISADGAFVVGGSLFNFGFPQRGVRWNSATAAAIEIGGVFSEVNANALSADGSVVVGDLFVTEPISGKIGFVWRFDPLFPSLQLRATTHTEVDVRDVTSNGSVMLFHEFDASFDRKTFRWNTVTDTGSMVVSTNADLAGEAFATGVGPQKFAGDSFSNFLSSAAFRWTNPGPEQLLCPLTGSCGSGYGNGTYINPQTLGMSADGNFVVGVVDINGGGYGNGGTVPFRFSDATGIQVLQNCQQFGYATDASADGSSVVGLMACGDTGGDAFLWTEADGFRLVRDVLSERGVDLSGWSQLHIARAISDDGTTITGDGRFNSQDRAWVAKLGPIGPVCDSIDFNNDGVSPDSLDIEDFISVYGGGPCSNDPLCNDIDFNNDGVSPDSLDVESIISVYGGGGCL